MDSLLLEEVVSGTRGGGAVASRQWEIVEKSRWQTHSQIALLVKESSIGPEAIIQLCNNSGS